VSRALNFYGEQRLKIQTASSGIRSVGSKGSAGAGEKDAMMMDQSGASGALKPGLQGVATDLEHGVKHLKLEENMQVQSPLREKISGLDSYDSSSERMSVSMGQSDSVATDRVPRTMHERLQAARKSTPEQKLLSRDLAL
jgi:hypothetical protein